MSKTRVTNLLNFDPKPPPDQAPSTSSGQWRARRCNGSCCQGRPAASFSAQAFSLPIRSRQPAGPPLTRP